MEYIKSGDYYIPVLAVEQTYRPIGHWGRLYRSYLQENHPIRFSSLILSGTLWDHLADVDAQARTRLARIIAQFKSAEGITENLKARDPMAWVAAMNSIRSRAEEIVLHELIYTEETI